MDDIKYFLCRGNNALVSPEWEAKGTYDKVKMDEGGIDLYTVRISFDTEPVDNSNNFNIVEGKFTARTIEAIRTKLTCRIHSSN